MTRAQAQVLKGMLQGESAGEGHGWTSRRMRLGYYYPGSNLISNTTPRMFAKLAALGLVEADASHAGNSHDTTWRLTEAGRAAARKA